MYKKLFSKRVIAGLLFIGLLIAGRILLRDHYDFQQLQAQRDILVQYVQHHYLFSVSIFMALYVLITTLMLPLAALMTVFGGLLFGIGWGTVYAVTGSVIGSCCGFLIIRYVGGAAVRERYKDRFKKFNDNVEQYGVFYLVTAHLFGVVPFFMIITAAALSPLTLASFACGTLVGVTPPALIYASLGRELQTITSFVEIFSPRILLFFLLFGLMGSLGLFFKRRSLRKQQNLQRN